MYSMFVKLKHRAQLLIMYIYLKWYSTKHREIVTRYAQQGRIVANTSLFVPTPVQNASLWGKGGRVGGGGRGSPIEQIDS
jgi:hypothetical protein